MTRHVPQGRAEDSQWQANETGAATGLDTLKDSRPAGGARDVSASELSIIDSARHLQGANNLSVTLASGGVLRALATGYLLAAPAAHT